MKRIIRDRRLTPEEITEDRKICEQIEQELPPEIKSPKATMIYVFVSFGSTHTGKNLGCCIVQVDDAGLPPGGLRRDREIARRANEKCRQLNLLPKECHEAQGFVLDDEEAFREQGMELNRLYTADEVRAMGFERA